MFSCGVQKADSSLHQTSCTPYSDWVAGDVAIQARVNTNQLCCKRMILLLLNCFSREVCGAELQASGPELRA
jgi:hypothetical protein